MGEIPASTPSRSDQSPVPRGPRSRQARSVRQLPAQPPLQRLIAFLELGLIENQKCDTLLKSHKQFVIAFQLYDDCADFYEDQSKEQFNWAIHMASNKGIPLDQFYQSTLFTALIDTVVNYLDRAADLVKELPKSKYSMLLKKIRDSVDSLYQV